MRAFCTILLSIPFMLFGQAKTAEQLTNQGLKKFNIERAEIQYVISGDAKGEEIMVFDSYGWKSLRNSTMTFELYGITSKQSLLEITNGDFVYRLNDEDSTYVVRKDLKWSQQATHKSPDQVSEAILFAMGGQQKTDSTLLDKTCQVWTFQGKAIQELWVWNGLVLKRKAKLGDRMIITTANSVEIDIESIETIFQIPSFYKEKN